MAGKKKSRKVTKISSSKCKCVLNTKTGKCRKRKIKRKSKK